MYRYKLTIAYVGNSFYGWQWQRTTQLPTVQGLLEEALQMLFSVRIPVIASSRTDTGVHAYAQVAHINIPKLVPTQMLFAELNRILPQEVRICSIERTDTTFHAQRSLYKIYQYSLWTSKTAPLPHYIPFVWHTPLQNKNAMTHAIPYLLGTRDFKTFQNDTKKTIDTIKTLYSIYTQEDIHHNELLHIYITGSGFLRQMVRNIIGLLVHVAQYKLQAEDIPTILLAKARTALPTPTAQPQGLTLYKIVYQQHTIYEQTPIY